MRSLFKSFKTESPNQTKWSFLLSLVVIAFAFMVLVSLLFSSFKYEYEEKFGSLVWSLFPEQEREERITIVAIDEQSLAEVGPWPWPRATMAELSNRLAEYGSALQLFDIVFPEAKEGDQAFATALQNNHGILAQIPIFDKQSALRSGELQGSLNATRCQFPIPSASSYLANSASIAHRQVGHITPVVDQDGMIRQQAPLVCIDGRVYPSLALQGLLSSLSNHPSVSVKNAQNLASSEWQIVMDSYFGLAIPINAQGNMRLSYRQSPDSFQYVSAANVLNGTAPEALLENSWVLIGATAFGLGDVVPTPHSGVTPGVELQARLLSNLLDGKTPYTPAYANWLLWLEGLLFVAVLLFICRLQTRASSYLLPLATLTLPLSAWAFHSYLLSFDIWLGWFNVACFSLIAGTLLLFADHQLLRAQHLRIFSHLSSYLPKPVAQSLANSDPSSAIEAKRHDLVLMCADLRNFSAYEESRPPEEAAALLHYFFTEASTIIESCGGQVEEYKGDSILASWHTEHDSEACNLALEAANALQEKVAEILPQRPPKGLEPMALGVGIERGSTLVGSIGPHHRRHHTLLGDTVTIVLRIQEMTQDLAQPILIGECAARSLHGEQLESQGSFLLDGLTTPHVLFAPKSHHIDPLAEQDLGRVVKLVHSR
ncbi:Adenylate cyclase 2 [Marinomonas aquimarina]|uniref:Adenylate cyclase 2 n=1 Tax=Marinomonas aquimarina TaxID=295068 RepID=A0A1A8T2D9_9GAMM|nr:adenylate/guanylate cyclase domain-containing protein [Marinomonas aquimarina]SBS25873.1 Adenylate cyclase 2 [Marinomonas aquimarina]